jgi:transposase
MKRRKHPRSLNVPAEPQIEWDFCEDDEAPAAPVAGATDRGVVFKEPDPRELFIGNQRLDRYLDETGLGEALVMADLFSSLDCWKAFETAYEPGGRAPYHPRLVVGLILLGLTEGRTSLRGLELLARADARAWWVCGGLCPDHSTLGKFINRHCDLLTGEFFEELTRKVIKATGGGASRLAGDGTVIEAMASRASLIRQEAAKLAAAEAKARAMAASDDKKLAREAELAEQVAETSRQRSAERKRKGRENKDAPVSATEPESVVQQQKNKTLRPSYKPSIMANEQRLIVGQAVDPTNEARVVEPMLEQAERISGDEAEELLLDAGYFSALVALLCYSADISLLCPQGKSDGDGAKPKASSKRFLKNQFRYDEPNDEYICPAGQRLRPIRRCLVAQANVSPYVEYRCDRCDGCSLRSKCTEAQNGRTLKRFEHDELLEALLLVIDQAQAQRVYRKRQGMVEPIFGELRYVQGLLRFRRRGLRLVKMEFALHAAAHNVRRYLRLTVGLADEGGEAAEATIATIFAFTMLLTLLSAIFATRPRLVSVSLHVRW